MTKTLMGAIGVAHRTITATLRAVIYARVSTEEQAKGYGIDAGEKRAKRYIEKKDWSYLQTFADEGVSGSLPWHERPDLKDLMELAQQKPRPFDVVVVPEGRVIGRLDRAYYPWVWKLEDLGVFVADAKLDIDNTTDEGRDKMREEANYAFKEYTRIRSRTQSGMQEHAEAGGYTGGYVPFGYRVKNMGKKKESRLVPDDCDHGADCAIRHDAPVARRGRELFVKHRNWQKATDELNFEGLFTRSGVPWSDANLRNILTGDALLNARQTFRSKSKAKLDRNGSPLYGDEVVIDLPPVFTDQERMELKVAIELTEKGPAVNRGRVYPVSGRLGCPCGGQYTGWNPTGNRAAKYRCNKGGPTCQLLNADAVEKRIWRVFQSALGDIERLQKIAADWVEKTQERDVDYEQRLVELASKIERQRKTISVTRMVAVSEALDRGLPEADAVQEAAEAVRPLNKHLAELEKLRADTAEWQAEAGEAALRASDLVTLARAAQERFGKLSPEKQARLFTLLDTTITVKGQARKGKAGVRCTLISWFRDRGLKVPTLTDRAWETISDTIPSVRGVDVRTAVEGMLHKARTGVSWTQLPKEFGNGPALRKIFTQWHDEVWPAAMDLLGECEGVEPFDPAPLPPMSIRTWVIPELLLETDVHLAAPASPPA